MNLQAIFGDPVTTWVIIPFLIFFARILDVSIGTIRLIFISKGLKILAPILGFLEVLIWLLAIGQILQNLTSWVNYFAYAAGFAVGNYLGMELEKRLALGTVILRVIASQDIGDLTQTLREQNYGATIVNAEGKSGPVKILFMLLSRSKLKKVVAIIQTHNEHAFYSVEDIRAVNQGIFPNQKSTKRHVDFLHRNWLKKRK